jgi:hypothetical protein
MKTHDGLLWKDRTSEQWKALPIFQCDCGQKFYQQCLGIVDCDDCISADKATYTTWSEYYWVTRGERDYEWIWSVKQMEKLLGRSCSEEYLDNCTGNIDTCQNDECMICSIKDCPEDDALHYHHDGCPSCYEKEQGASE